MADHTKHDRESTRKRHKETVIKTPVQRYVDSLWQQNPHRMLKYRPSHLHAYGWVPFFNIHNMSATVFSSTTLLIQSVLLVAWMVFLHTTGLWLPTEDLKSFSLVFGTPYLGAIFNGCMLVTFLLGMFASLVVQRWWAIRQAYAKVSSSTVDLALIIASQIKPYLSNQRENASVELVRLLNLGHILMLQAFDQGNQDFRSLNIGGSSTSEDTQPSTEEAFGLFRRRFKYTNFQDLNSEGLVNLDEWEKIQGQKKLGLEPYVTVYYWAQSLAVQCQQKGLLSNSAAITGKIGGIVEAASSIFTFIRTQMPYPYVHLVSMMVHIYLLFIATYVGLFLYIGFPNDRATDSVSGATTPDQISFVDDVLQNNFETTEFMSGWESLGLSFGASLFMEIKLKQQYFTAAILYVVVVAMNCVLQGMLDMQSLLDNPFGQHVAKFPLRQTICEVMNATRAMLTCSNDFPKIFKDICGDDEEEENKQQQNN
eukprot:TRINITY_DN342_c0_g1_i2.p1 TRINITY_DN342_c0_g1~~TRINITY_DN342_c0_g1_i2.p1  ORF type:complete len:517 (-),score=80.40 TRINITY_DN342_c0_g1_i2:1593-3035(-)